MGKGLQSHKKIMVLSFSVLRFIHSSTQTEIMKFMIVFVALCLAMASATFAGFGYNNFGGFGSKGFGSYGFGGFNRFNGFNKFGSFNKFGFGGFNRFGQGFG